MPQVIVRVMDHDGANYDGFVMAPEGLGESDAVAIVDAAIVAVKEQNPDEFTYDDLFAALRLEGFTPLDNIVPSGEYF